LKSAVVAIDARSVGRDHTGDTTYWTGLVRGLAELDSKITYLLFSNAPAPPGIPISDRFRWIELNSHSARWWSLFRFPLVARRMGARVFHVQYNLSPLITHGGVTTIHDVSFYHEPAWFQPRDRLLLQRFVPPSARRAERVVTVSEFSKREILRYISGLEGKVVVSPNACADDVQPMERSLARDRVKAELGLGDPYLLTVGTRWPRKNLNLALGAAEALGASCAHRLVVTGKAGWGEETTSSRAISTGYVDIGLLNALYSAADLYLAPALYEGFGITLLEAFRCGCPVLASANGAHEEVSAGAAAIEPSWEPRVWADRIESLVRSPVELAEMREAGIQRECAFNWKHSAAIVEGVYRELLS
jgi:glycosyltransferase involved in cell wall biosynthesis